MGRPTSMTEKVIDKLEEAFSWGCTDEEACGHADICKGTLYEYQLKYPAFVERKEQLKIRPLRLARKAVVDSFSNPKPDAEMAMKYLERKKKDEFSTKQEVEANVTFEPVKFVLKKHGDD
jgi:hypothetical protein